MPVQGFLPQAKPPKIHTEASWKATVYGDRLTDYIGFVPNRKLLAVPAILLTSVALHGCALLFGNVAPVSVKSGKYEVNGAPAGWRELSDEEKGEVSGDPDVNAVSDVAYQSQATQSIISVNSACRPSLDWDNLVPEERRAAENKKQLRSFTRQLLMGIVPSAPPKERELVVAGEAALETTLAGTLNDQSTKIRTVVLRRKDCLYDLMYVAQPEQFDADLDTYSRFVASLRIHR